MARFVALVRDADPATPVPTCPGWTLTELLEHHGRTHRWIRHLIMTGATERIWSRDVPLDLPDRPAGLPAWLAASAELSLVTLRGTDPDTPVWTPGADRHVRFFPRRLLFEAVIHHADAAIALGRRPGPDAATSADGIDEFLTNLPHFDWVPGRPMSRCRRGRLSCCC